MAEPEPTIRTAARQRRTLLQRLFLANAVVLVVAAALLIVTPVTISATVTLQEVVLVLGAVVAMLATTLLLLRRALAPLREVTWLMRTIDPLEPGRRLTGAADADAEVATLVATLQRDARSPRAGAAW